jgi:hypothetical protein
LPFYVNSQALLADIRLRLEGLGTESAALVVEGPDDKRLFYERTASSAEVVVAGGKRLVRAALAAMLEGDHGRILFLTDCDYDVRTGELNGGPDIIITKGCDVEADLISLGLLEKIAVELAPHAVETKVGASRIGTEVREHAMRMCLTLGRIRMASQPLGIDLELDKLDLGKYWDKPSDRILVDKLTSSTWGRVKASGVSFTNWQKRINDMPADDAMCCGKDLIRSSRLFFRALYGMDNKVTADSIAMMLRLALDDERFEGWTVVERIRKWEAIHGRKVFNNSV